MATLPNLVQVTTRNRRHILDFFWKRRRGVITGAADNDPAGIVTYLQIGATTGFSLIWLLVLSTPMLIAIEDMSARVGQATQKGLAEVLRAHYGVTLAALCVLIVTVANLVTIGADLSAIADIISNLTYQNELYYLYVILIGLVLLLLLLRGSYRAVSRFLFLLTPVLLTYVVTVFLVHPAWGKIVTEGLIPRWQTDFNFWALAVGMLGTTVTPFLIFWETTEEIEEHTPLPQRAVSRSGVIMGMVYSNLTAIFMILCGAAVLYGTTGSFETARQAALSLRPLAGNGAFALFSLGIIGAGMLAIPILSSTTAYTLADLLGWRRGLDRKEWQAKGFYTIILLAILIGIGVGIGGINPIRLLVYSQVLNGFLVPFLVLALLLIASNRKVMGQAVNSFWISFWGWLCLIALTVADGFAVWGEIKK